MSQENIPVDRKLRRRWRRYRMFLYFIASIIALVALIAVDILFLKRLLRESMGPK